MNLQVVLGEQIGTVWSSLFNFFMFDCAIETLNYQYRIIDSKIPMEIAFLSTAFVVALFIIGLIFVILAVLSVIQLFRASSIQEEEQISQMVQKDQPKSILVSLYYCFLTLFALLSAAFLLLFSVLSVEEQQPNFQNHENSTFEKVYNNSAYIPDTVFFILNCLIFSQMVLYNEFAHLRYGNLFENRKTLGIARTFYIPQKLKILLGTYLMGQIAIIVLYNVNIIVPEAFNLLDFCFNLSLPLLLIGYLIYNSRKYSGAPLRSAKMELNISALRNILIYLSTGRLIECLQDFYLAAKPNAAYYLISLPEGSCSISDYFTVGGICINLILCQLVPFGLSLQDKYVRILSMTFYEDKLLNFDDEEVPAKEIAMVNDNRKSTPRQTVNNVNNSDLKTEEEFNKTKFSITDYKDRSIIQINIDEVTFESVFKQESISQVQLGELQIGVVKSGKYKDKRFLIRKLQIKRLSQYLIEEMNRNIQEYRSLSCKYIQPIKALSFDQENVYFFTPYFENGNIQQFINSPNPIEIEKKKKVLEHIAIGMAYLYSQTPPISHGHLIPNNIMITKTGDYKLIDFGLAAMKKYVALITGYTTKCQYTLRAPEQIKDRSQTPSFNQQADIYSFGLLAWELFHQKSAFKGLSLQELAVKVGEEKKRPKIDEGIDIQIATIIRACWQDEAEKRPTFDIIVRSFQGASVNFSTEFDELIK